ncbi:MAG TPA: DUF58 domain-containing protein [Candidatus Binatia bacterium]|nr:DUF58 domain-containing protein [Candidatus Binatia bacterium]
MTLRGLLEAFLRTPPPRPTRDGWWCLGASLGLGFAAMNTGNNLLYLLTALLLALVMVSGVLSEQSRRGLRLRAVVPDEIYAGRPFTLGARLENLKRRRASRSLSLETPEGGLYVDRLAPGEARLLTWETTLPRRGRQRLRGARITTRFPFGLFVKTSRLLLDAEVVVFPAVRPLADAWRRRLADGGVRSVRRRGRGHDLYNLRDYRPGDDRRLIHWRSSAKTGNLVVRELEAETALDTRLVLVGGGARDPERLEAALSEAASLAAHLIRADGAVELVGPGVHVPSGRGRGHLRRLLTALALLEPTASHPPRTAQRPGVSDLEIALG